MLKAKIQNYIEGRFFQNLIITLIIINAIILGLQTSSLITKDYGSILTSIDDIILIVFVIEIALRLFVYRWGVFKRPWSVFDFIVISFSFFPSSEAFAALRTLRVLRVLRLISTIPAMRRVIESLISAIPGIVSVASIMLIFFYVFAVIGTHLYGEQFPEWFGSLGSTMFTLFQVMTLESWSMGIVRPILDIFPNAWIYFVSYIVITTFTMLNLFIAIIVNSMNQLTEESAKDSREELREAISGEINEMEARLLKQLKKLKD